MWSDAPSYLEPPQVDAGKEFVQIFVGKQTRPTYCHKALICACSRFFTCAFLGTFREGQENKMNLPEEETRLFEILLEWLYERPLSLDSYMRDFSVEADELWLDVFYMAHRLAVDKLCAVALYELHDMFDGYAPAVAPSTGFIDKMYATDLLPQLREYVIKHTAFWDVQDRFLQVDHLRLQDSPATHPLFRAGLYAANAEYRTLRSVRVLSLRGATNNTISHPEDFCRVWGKDWAKNRCDGRCFVSKETLIDLEHVYPH
ncbi:hypothetical protein PV08_08155 [Exophiala spinifera]|uniref:BTB domain-containing protein n=1 Tax=Exophiala spinifera TaxID=91928 RepID=A0A0D2B257_9EURO|nr:uncharacterized protein PV08_08155 [Exophiala spinifera]KIW12968.1 hypothetical protein PV08_08155 [Exophiala spinifera]